MTEDVLAADGRTARRERNRIAVLDAALELFTEGQLQPAIHDVAERSGVSLRSVYRYFDDGDELLRAAIERSVEKVWDLYHFEGYGVGTFDERLERILDSRLALYVAVAPTARAANQHLANQPVIANGITERRAALRKQIERHFASELDAMAPSQRMSSLAACNVLMQFEGLEMLHLRHSTAEVRAILADALTTLLVRP